MRSEAGGLFVAPAWDLIRLFDSENWFSMDYTITVLSFDARRIKREEPRIFYT